VSSPLARLRDSFVSGIDPRSALFCTYGFDAPFFEAEILAAVFPARLNLDRESGSRAGYLNAADTLMQSSPVLVFFDHLTSDGPGLPYVAARVDVKPRAFHAKLMVLEYDDRFRVVVSSANLTRPAWTNLLELFVFEDLMLGEQHPWSASLQRFLEQLERFVAAERRDDVSRFRSALAAVPTGGSGTRLVSSWDRSLLASFREGLPSVSRVDVVTPFFETVGAEELGDESEGALDQIDRLGSAPRGRLFVSAQALENRLEIRGPREKIDELLRSGRWTLHRVAEEWEGDQEGAPLRALHGKMLAACDDSRCRVMVGSANITNAALLRRAPGANVELVVLAEMTPAQLRQLLPQASPLDRDGVEIVDRTDPTGEDDDTEPGAERWVESAIYWAARDSIEVRLAPGAPPISVFYEGTKLGVVETGIASFEVALRESFAIEVSDGESVGVVPLLLADPAVFAPRGGQTTLDLEAFCELLAGAREGAMSTGELPGESTGSSDEEQGLAPKHGGIPWRRILAAIHGLGISIKDEAPFPRGVEFVLHNPMKLAGLLHRLEKERDVGRFQEADHAFALHEVRRMLLRVTHELQEHEESLALVREALDTVSKRYESIRTQATNDLAGQLLILENEIAP
jgi:hypothetical protein